MRAFYVVLRITRFIRFVRITTPPICRPGIQIGEILRRGVSAIPVRSILSYHPIGHLRKNISKKRVQIDSFSLCFTGGRVGRSVGRTPGAPGFRPLKSRTVSYFGFKKGANFGTEPVRRKTLWKFPNLDYTVLSPKICDTCPHLCITYYTY